MKLNLIVLSEMIVENDKSITDIQEIQLDNDDIIVRYNSIVTKTATIKKKDYIENRRKSDVDSVLED